VICPFTPVPRAAVQRTAIRTRKRNAELNAYEAIGYQVEG
jgi:hypothetical protein